MSRRSFILQIGGPYQQQAGGGVITDFWFVGTWEIEVDNIKGSASAALDSFFLHHGILYPRAMHVVLSDAKTGAVQFRLDEDYDASKNFGVKPCFKRLSFENPFLEQPQPIQNPSLAHTQRVSV